MNKVDVIASAMEFVRSKIERLQLEINELKESNASNTKSTAGDKHETGRAMVHLEMEKLGNQLVIEQKVLHNLTQIQSTRSLGNITKGSLVTTNKGVYLLGAAVGKFNSQGQMVFGISMESPLAHALLYKTIGDAIELNGNRFEVKEVV